MKNFPTSAVSSRRLVLVLLSALVLVVLTARGVSFAPELAHAAPPAITVNEVDQSPSTSVGSVALGSTITYTVHITLSAGQAAGMSIALRGNANIGPAGRTVTCSAPAGNNVPNQSTGTPSCGWPGPVTSGAYTLTFFGPVNGPIDDAVPFASSRVCSDTNNNNSCSDEAAGDIVDLLDASGDVGPLTIIGSAPAAPVLSVNEVSQTPAGGSTVAVNTPITYTVNITLSAPMPPAQSLTIQLKADGNITPAGRTISCTGASPLTTSGTGGGAVGCLWHYPVAAGAYQMVFSGPLGGSIGDAVPDASSVVCDDTNSTNTCGDELAGVRVPLADNIGNDVGLVTVTAATPPAVSNAQVNQTPPGGTPAPTVPLNTLVTYSATVTLTAAQSTPLTIQLKGDANLTNRTVTCAATTGNPSTTVATGNPACKWTGPVIPGVQAGTFTVTFSGTMAGGIGDAVPDPVSVVCADTNSNNSCEDEAVGAKVALADADNDVGPLAIAGAGGAPAVSAAEVDQTPVGGSTVPANTHVTYTANVTLTANQAQSVTIQLRGDANLINRSLSCSSIGNATAPIINSTGNPSCRWAGPVNAGTFSVVLGGDASGSIGDAVPDAASVVCTDTNNAGGCDDEAAGAKVALLDASGDVGPLTVPASAPVVTSEVTQTPAGGTTVAAGTHITYTVQLILTTAQTLPLTIQLKGDSHIINRALSCTSSTNGSATTVGASGNPSCMWNGPLLVGAFFFTFTGDLNGSIGDAVPDAVSVACSDLNSSNSCDDEVAGAKVALLDANGDVGPVAVTGGPAQYRLYAPIVAADGVTP